MSGLTFSPLRSGACACVLALLLCGCSLESKPFPGPVGLEPLTVAVSIPPQAYLVERIGGTHVHVVTVLRPGENPHSYLPSDADISQVMRSGVYFRSGVPFEDAKWFQTVAHSERLRIVDLREGITLREMAFHADDDGPAKAHDGHERFDPHIWLAPALLKQQAQTIARTLSEVLPDAAAEFQRNLQTLEKDLDTLDATIRAQLAKVRGANLYVYHPSWGYFCDAYGLHQVAVEVEGKEPSDAELTALQVQARGQQVRVIFVQPQIAGRSAQAVAKALGAEVRILDPLARDVVANLSEAAQAIAEGAR